MSELWFIAIGVAFVLIGPFLTRIADRFDEGEKRRNPSEMIGLDIDDLM